MGVIWVNPGAHDITIRDLTIDTSAATNTDEQFHAIEIGNGVGTGTIQDVRIEHVRFNHPGANGWHKGDCIHLVGNTPQSAVHRVMIIGATFMSCARSNITIQKNVFDLIIQEDQFTESRDYGINGEQGLQPQRVQQQSWDDVPQQRVGCPDGNRDLHDSLQGYLVPSELNHRQYKDHVVFHEILCWGCAEGPTTSALGISSICSKPLGDMINALPGI